MEEKDVNNPEFNEEDEVVELIDEFGVKTQFYHLGSMDYKGKLYAFFTPAEEIEGSSQDDVVVFEVSGDDKGGMLLPIEDEDLLQEVFDEFVKEYDGDYADEDESIGS